MRQTNQNRNQQRRRSPRNKNQQQRRRSQRSQQQQRNRSQRSQQQQRSRSRSQRSSRSRSRSQRSSRSRSQQQQNQQQQRRRSQQQQNQQQQRRLSRSQRSSRSRSQRQRSQQQQRSRSRNQRSSRSQRQRSQQQQRRRSRRRSRQQGGFNLDFGVLPSTKLTTGVRVANFDAEGMGVLGSDNVMKFSDAESDNSIKEEQKLSGIGLLEEGPTDEALTKAEMKKLVEDLKMTQKMTKFESNPHLKKYGALQSEEAEYEALYEKALNEELSVPDKTRIAEIGDDYVRHAKAQKVIDRLEEAVDDGVEGAPETMMDLFKTTKGALVSDDTRFKGPHTLKV